MTDRYDVVLVGAGIMGATLAALLHELDPAMRLLMLERLDGPALESSAAANNAGTGHAANCELNYTPQQGDGSVATAKALAINAAFERSLEFWATLRERGELDTPAKGPNSNDRSPLMKRVSRCGTDIGGAPTLALPYTLAR